MRPPSSPTEPETRLALVDYAQHGGVALLTLNNPPANAYTHEMHRELDAPGSAPSLVISHPTVWKPRAALPSKRSSWI